MNSSASTPTPHQPPPAGTGPAAASSTTPSPAGPGPTPPIPAAPTRPARPAPVDDSRPFGAHLRLRWWKPLIIVPSLLIVMVVLQIALSLVALIIESFAFGRDPLDASMSPLLMLAANLSLAAVGPLAIVATALIGRVPWRRLLASPRRMSLRRWGVYFGAFSLLVIIGLAVMQLIDPGSTGLTSFAVTSTTVGLLVVALLTTPLQAAGEELMFRGAVMPLIASWIRAAKPALIVGLVSSSLIFGLVHLSLDPWLLAYYSVFGASMAAIAVISRGLEAPIAFHVTNNLIMMVLAALFAGGEAVEIDRSVGMGGPFMLGFIAVDLVAIGFVWLYERRMHP